jgi:hypothetical protein
MGQLFSRADAWSDPDYIVNLTTNIVGKNALGNLAAWQEGQDGRALYVFFHERIEKEVRKMSDQTLGRICAYGGPEGMHDGLPHAAPFLNMTGFKDVMHWTLDPLQKDGRSLMEEIAILTIACIARDIIMQKVWQDNVAYQLNLDEQYDRAMADYIHHGPQR